MATWGLERCYHTLLALARTSHSIQPDPGGGFEGCVWHVSEAIAWSSWPCGTTAKDKRL